MASGGEPPVTSGSCDRQLQLWCDLLHRAALVLNGPPRDAPRLWQQAPPLRALPPGRARVTARTGGATSPHKSAPERGRVIGPYDRPAGPSQHGGDMHEAADDP